ncbi:FmdB family zinc ribbon protein [Desulfoferrobacter suflitae]|uniref:FmdB family zinc ribbon protein n=1 Tax=Desulfoferrobacter suflitae TaxID=2865782 RepID=UPI0021648C6F|nr:zinc ribbon domain-containing protein [Desulfoferrobacter suflitae]MCK8603127.1 zinc ribbon domain-containing protein [Desulfoferrobacter suflitae]
MPIYEYECTKCGKVTEAMQKFSDPPLVECCECRGGLRKLVSMSTFHLKGSGWYTTDYAGKNQSTSSSKTESTATEKAESPKKESKSSTE